MSSVGFAMMHALAESAPKRTLISYEYEAKRRVLMLYGAGYYKERFTLMQQHLERGGQAIVWDKGYWDRDNSLRFSLDGLHPSASLLAAAPEYAVRRKIELREDADSQGPILLAGLGYRGCSLWFKRDGEWEEKTLAMIRERWPGREVKWRPRDFPYPNIKGVSLSVETHIEDALKGCSMVVCHCSNVAVDATIAGIPVVCEGGAAQILYRDSPHATRSAREDFLRRLGWFNWSVPEARYAWKWIAQILGEKHDN
jgi:hypothetical protein